MLTVAFMFLMIETTASDPVDYLKHSSPTDYNLISHFPILLAKDGFS